MTIVRKESENTIIILPLSIIVILANAIRTYVTRNESFTIALVSCYCRMIQYANVKNDITGIATNVANMVISNR